MLELGLRSWCQTNNAHLIFYCLSPFMVIQFSPIRAATFFGSSFGTGATCKRKAYNQKGGENQFLFHSIY